MLRPVLLGLARDVDVVVTSRPGAWTGVTAPIVAVPLPALARRFDGDLPAGVIDAGSAVMTYGDQIGWVEEIDAATIALDPGSVPHDRLMTWASTADPTLLTPGPRVLVQEDRASRLLSRTLQALALDGSVVVTSAATSAALAEDSDRLDRLRSSERIDHPCEAPGRRHLRHDG
ncbi:hypothetical protein NKG05_21100 [Oerskovia sp. M15]